MDFTTPLVFLDQVTLEQKKRIILRDVSFKIMPGEFVYMIGKTGSGKSTLMKCLYGELPPASGKGFVTGFDIQGLHWKKIPDLRRNLGIVFQDFHLLSDRNVADNLSFVMKATGWKNKQEQQQRIREVLKRVDLENKEDAMPFELSGGEQQRVVIARALLNSPPLILADEPTGNLDPDTSDEIIKLLYQLCKNEKVAVLMATHDYTILEKFPGKILRIASGKVFWEEGMTM